ncbi:hypothetical protein QE363_001480 [Sphingomonas sp. SORGH_AS870]|nr:hypothetical protein [Sphingomonas sp. SORGH_AS_0870]
MSRSRVAGRSPSPPRSPLRRPCRARGSRWSPRPCPMPRWRIAGRSPCPPPMRCSRGCIARPTCCWRTAWRRRASPRASSTGARTGRRGWSRTSPPRRLPVHRYTSSGSGPGRRCRSTRSTPPASPPRRAWFPAMSSLGSIWMRGGCATDWPRSPGRRGLALQVPRSPQRRPTPAWRHCNSPMAVGSRPIWLSTRPARHGWSPPPRGSRAGATACPAITFGWNHPPPPPPPSTAIAPWRTAGPPHGPARR